MNGLRYKKISAKDQRKFRKPRLLVLEGGEWRRTSSRLRTYKAVKQAFEARAARGETVRIVDMFNYTIEIANA